MKRGDIVQHWFAGRGMVLRVKKRLVQVRWSNGKGKGWAYIAECKSVSA